MNRVCRHMEEDGYVFIAHLDYNGHAIAVRLERHMSSEEKNELCAMAVQSVRATVGGNVTFTLELSEFSPDVQTIIVRV